MSRLVALLGVVAVLAVAGVAIAAGGGSKPVTLCAVKGSGEVFLGSKKGKCAKGTTKLVVGKQGPQGPSGAAGAAGPTGPAGKSLTLTQGPLRAVAPTVGDCSENPGTFCGSPGALGTWEPLIENLYYRKDAAGWVHLMGGGHAAESGEAFQWDNDAAIFYLPPGYRPTDGIHRFHVSFSSCHNPGTISWVDVLPNGAVKPRFNIGCVSLGKVAFRP